MGHRCELRGGAGLVDPGLLALSADSVNLLWEE